MIVTTSATTVTTVTYLSLYELEQYKKQFQSFWIPFMEQFIPATTIWVAGERWCNDICTIINPCDYDFELVEAEISVQEIPTGIPPKTSTAIGGFTSPVKPSIVNTDLASGTATGTIPKELATMATIKDLGLTSERLLIKTVAETNIDLSAYESKFTAEQTERIVI